MSTVASKPMKEVSVEEILETYNLIVPEIQREYVWGYNEHGIFETFLKDIKDGYASEGETTPDVASLKQTIENPALDETTRNSLKEVLKNLGKSKKSINIGFLYSYKPSYYIGNDREEDLYLIDGQQRFTTLFLVLYYFAIKENRRNEFVSLFKFDADREKIAFDYRVRSITHQFIIDLIDNSETVFDLLNVRTKQWFLSNYGNDVTVKSIVGTDKSSSVFNLLEQVFGSDEKNYFDFVKKDIKFWHFKTEETSQGEELYITMNSRGQQLADNENIRAKLFDNDEVKKNPLEWSEKWEHWQDFFWKNRNKKDKESTADEGFNEFLRWVQILKMYQDGKRPKSPLGIVPIDQSFIKTLQWGASSKLDKRFLSLEDIELTFNAVKYLFKELAPELEANVKPLYQLYSDFSLIDNKWLGPEEGQIALIDLFKLLPAILFCKKHIAANLPIDCHNQFRLIRLLHSLSKDDTIAKAIRNQIANVLTVVDSLNINDSITVLLEKAELSKTILNAEVKQKLELYKLSSEIVQTEDLFWYTEDLWPNNGEIGHLINLCKGRTPDNVFDLAIFKRIATVFCEFVDNEDEIRGDLIPSDVYTDKFDRVDADQYWHKNNGFLDLISLRLNSSADLKSFLLCRQKTFIQRYRSVEHLASETSSKNQLYIYYILSANRILKTQPSWRWHEGYNFGKFSHYGGFKSIFDQGDIYQMYKLAFRDNDVKILEVQRAKYKVSFGELIDWSNN